MKKQPDIHADPDGLGEYDLSKGVRGKYANHRGEKSKVVVHGVPELREQFPGYYELGQPENERLWQEGIFVLDANVLLHFYAYSIKTRREFFSVLKKLQDRIWLPHQVVQEYFRRRVEVIAAQRNVYGEVEATLTKCMQTLENDLKNFEKYEAAKIKDTIKRIGLVVEREKKRIKDVKTKQPNYSDVDDVLNNLEKLFRGKIGEPYTTVESEAILRTAQLRITHQIPPGYKDAPKVGDVVIWLQLLDYAEIVQRPVIFVTDDAKDDWWLKSNGLKPRPELVQEMHNTANVAFNMYLAHAFLREATEFLKRQGEEGASAEAIEEVEEVREQDEVADATQQAQHVILGNILAREHPGRQMENWFRQINETTNMAALRGPDLSAIAQAIGSTSGIERAFNVANLRHDFHNVHVSAWADKLPDLNSLASAKLMSDEIAEAVRNLKASIDPSIFAASDRMTEIARLGTAAMNINTLGQAVVDEAAWAAIQSAQQELTSYPTPSAVGPLPTLEIEEEEEPQGDEKGE